MLNSIIETIEMTRFMSTSHREMLILPWVRDGTAAPSLLALVDRSLVMTYNLERSVVRHTLAG
jgi:hypothetical protein